MEKLLQKHGLIAAILSFIVAGIGFLMLASDASWIFDEFNVIMIGFGLYYLLMIAGFVLVGVGLLKEKKLACVGFLLNAVSAFSFFVIGFFDNQYYLHIYGYSYGRSEGLNVLCSMPILWEVFVFAVLAVFAGCMYLPALAKYKEKLKDVWFVPAILVISVILVALFTKAIVLGGTDGYWSAYVYYIMNFGHIVLQLLITAIALLIGLPLSGITANAAVAQPVYTAAPVMNNGGVAPAQPAAANNGANAVVVAQPSVYPEGYQEMVKHVMLLILTCGIWNLIWIYKTTNFLNRVNGEAPRNATTQLLLCMFVPFYMIYWVYVSAQRIDKLAAQKGVSSDLTMICLLCAIFLYVLAPIFMQEKINNIVMPKGQTAQATPAAQPAPVAPVEVAPVVETPVAPVETAPVVETPVAPVETAPVVETPVAPVEVAPVVETPVAPVETAKDVASELKTYKDLLDSGIITQEEFDAKKKQILGL